MNDGVFVAVVSGAKSVVVAEAGRVVGSQRLRWCVANSHTTYETSP